MYSNLNLSAYLELISLARKRLTSPQAYLQFQVLQGELLAAYLLRHNVMLQAHTVLDVACGVGGYGLAMEKQGARVFAFDRFTIPTWKARNFFLSDAQQIPLPSNGFDLVVAASLIEHVLRPEYLIDELARVTRAGGYIYLSFPPFYSPLGGHQFSPFHLLGERMAIKIFQKFNPLAKYAWIEEDYSVDPHSFSSSHGQWGLYRRTILQVRRLLSHSKLRLIDQSTRLSPINVSRIPFLGEFLTWHVQFLLEKPERQ